MQYIVPRSEFPATTIAPAHHAVFDTVIAAAVVSLHHDGFQLTYTGGARPREVVRLIAHALRIHLLTAPTESVPAWAYGRAPAMGLLHDDVAVAIDYTDPARRRAAGMSLISGLRGSAGNPTAKPVRLLGNWLPGQNPTDAAAGMARWMSHQFRSYHTDLGLAWWRIHGRQLIPKVGRDHRLFDLALTRRWEAGGITIEGLAELTRLTPDDVQARVGSKHS